MFKKILVFLLLPVLLFSAETITKDYSFQEPKIIDGSVYLKGCRITREAFAPRIAVKPVKLLIPYGHKVVSYEVKYSEPVLMNGEYSLTPFKPSGRISVAPPANYHRKMSEVYSMNTFYPAAVKSEYSYTQVKNGHSIFISKVYPVQYNAVTAKIKYFKNISFTVQTEPKRAPLPKYHCTPFVKGYLHLLADNHEAIDKLPLTKKGADDYEYLIVTSGTLQNSFADFVAFNERRCLRTKVESIDDVIANSSGKDNADKLRNYIKGEYENNNIMYVLLGHDVNTVPYRGFRAQMYDYGTVHHDDKNIPGDMYFSCLDGSWQNEGSSYYGEFGCEDIGWEVYTARFAVGSGDELSNMINKTISHQETPVKSEVLNNCLSGEWLWGTPQHPVDCWGGDCMEQYVGVCSDNFYTTTGFGEKWNTTRLYEKNSSWSKSSFINAVKNDKLIWIDHLGHSNSKFIIKCNNSDVTNGNFSNANGTVSNYFLIYTQGCNPNDFTVSDCIGEQFTSKLSNAAFAFIGNSRYGLGDDGYQGSSGTDGSSHRLQRHFHDALFGKKIHYLEMMLAYSKEVNVDIITDSDIKKKPYFGQLKYCCYEVNILGDPAVSMWTDTPKDWTELPKAAATGTEFTMETPPLTWVAILDENDKIITTQLTSFDSASWDSSFVPDNGDCKINDDVYKTYAQAHIGGDLKVRIKAHNYMPYTGTVTIAATSISNEIKLSLSKNLKFFNDRITYSLPYQGKLTLSVYNSKGSLIKTVLRNNQSGAISLKNISSGIYYVQLKFKDMSSNKKFIISK